jgi:hypothetical protein
LICPPLPPLNTSKTFASPSRIDLRVLSMVLPVFYITISQFAVMDHEQVLCIVLLGCLCKIERSCNNNLSINDDNFIVGYGVLGAYSSDWESILVRMPELAIKSAAEYCFLLWLLSRITATLTPRLRAFRRAFPIGADV